MKHETLWFRMAVGTLAATGALVLVFASPGHRLPRDDAKLPSVVGPAPQTQAR